MHAGGNTDILTFVLMKTKKSVSTRIKITKSGKVQRRSTSLGHSRANKNSVQLGRRKRLRGLVMRKKTINQYI